MRTLFCALTATLLLLGCNRPSAPPRDIQVDAGVAPVLQPNDDPADPITLPLQWQFERDAAGRLARAISPGGKETTFRHETDDAGRLRKTTREQPGGVRVMTEYDEFGRRTAQTDATGAVRFGYDGYGRLISVRRDGAPSLTYGYDTEGRRTSIRVGDRFQIEYAYDFLGRLDKIATPKGDIRYEYRTGQNETICTLPNGVRTIRRHTPDGKLESIAHAAADNKLLARFTYAYRPDGLIREVKEWSPKGEKTLAYEYDTVQRLIAVTDAQKGRPDAKTVYRYDNFGNRVEVTEADGASSVSSFDWSGALSRHAGRPCRHDATANLTGYMSSHGWTEAGYTADNQLASIQTEQAKLRYEYDGDGLLTARVSGERRTSFVADPTAGIWRPLLRKDADDKETFYIWDGDTPLGAIAGGETRFFLHDHLGSVRGLADATGKLTEYRDYGAFGALRAKADDPRTPGFAGLFHDTEAGLYLTRARAYDPTLGCFLQRDPQHRLPMGSQKDLSPYAYCGDDPVNYCDTNGVSPFQPWRTNDLNPLPNFNVARPLHHQAGKIIQDVVRSNFNNPIDRFGAWMRHHDTFNVAPSIGGNLTLGRGFGVSIGVAVNVNTYRALSGLALTGGNPVPALLKGITSAGGFYSTEKSTGLHAGFGPSITMGTGPFSYGPAKNWTVGEPLSGTISQDLNTKKWSSVTLGLPGGFAVGSYQSRSETHPLGPTINVSNLGGAARGGSASPTKVGGVSLRGAGDALKHLGPLQGLALDANGRLVLIARDKGDVELPPLDLDDVVTVFRSVYDTPEGPFVSIDPVPEAPKGPRMNIRLPASLKKTYVGWVLFEADRVMKTYSLGQDNLTGKEFVSALPGYQKHLDLRFTEATAANKETLWERYWIVPAAVNQARTKDGRLSLFQIPLKLNTEAMVLRGGKLVTAPNGKSSARARYFTEWFTTSFEGIAREARSQLPKDSGREGEVAIFAELQRISLIAALAERLRDDGVAMPAWMRQHAVKPFQMPDDTPSTTVESVKKVGGRKLTRSIYGGVTLSAPRSQVKIVEAAPEAEALAPVLARAVAAAPALELVAFEHDGKRYTAVALPGDDTLDVGACQLAETDLNLLVHGEARVSLTRHYNSTFQPADVFDRCWTLDLPRLEQTPGRLSPDGASRLLYYRLTSPLGTADAIFPDIQEVPQVKAKLHVPQKAGPILGVGKSNGLGVATDVVLFRDGRAWHFVRGNLVAIVQGSFTLHYHREAGRLTKIEGRYRGDEEHVASIRLDYDGDGRLAKLTGSDGSTVVYRYDGEGRLTEVNDRSGQTGYRHQAGLVTAVLKDDKPLRHFEYDGHGRVRRETAADGTSVEVAVKNGPDSVIVTTSTTRKDNAKAERETAIYDRSFRPLRRDLVDGTTLAWSYPKDGGTELTGTLPDRSRVVVRRSANGKQETWKLPEGGTYARTLDDAGRLTKIREGTRTVRRQEWSASGRLAVESSESTALRREYTPGGAVKRLLITPPGHEKSYKRWLDIEYDGQGRAVKLADSSGEEIELTYDPKGGLSEWFSKSKKSKVVCRRDGEGRLTALETTGGRQEAVFEGTGEKSTLKELTVTQGDERAKMEFEEGRLARVRQFDGGETGFDYYGSSSKGQLRTVRTPNGLALAYEYDDKGRVRAVDCGEAGRYEYRFDRDGRLTALAHVPPKK